MTSPSHTELFDLTDSIPTPLPVSPPAVADRADVLRDIHEKWNRFSDQDMKALTSVDELVRKVSSKYGQDKTNARIEVDAFLKGRTI